MTSVGWLGLSPVAWSLVAVVSSSVGLWAARWAERRVHGWVRVGVRLLAAGLQFSLVLCGLSVLVVHLSPRAQAVAILAAAVGAAVWRFFVLAAPAPLAQGGPAGAATVVDRELEA